MAKLTKIIYFVYFGSLDLSWFFKTGLGANWRGNSAEGPKIVLHIKRIAELLG